MQKQDQELRTQEKQMEELKKKNNYIQSRANNTVEKDSDSYLEDIYEADQYNYILQEKCEILKVIINICLKIENRPRMRSGFMISQSSSS